MRIMIFYFLFAVTSAAFKSSEIFTKKLFVPENSEDFLRTRESYVEQSKDQRIANGTDAVDGQFSFCCKLFDHFYLQSIKTPFF